LPRYRADDLGLQHEDIRCRKYPVIGLGPYMLIRHGVDQLHVDAYLVTGSLHRALQDHSYAEFGGDAGHTVGRITVALDRRSRNDLERVALRQARKQAVLDPRGKKTDALIIRTLVFERQNRDRPRRRAGGPPPVMRKDDKGRTQHGYDDEIDPPPRDVGNGSAGLHVLLEADALRRDFVEPGQEHRDRESDGEYAEDRRPDPGRQVAEADEYLCDLHDEPRRDDIKYRHAEHVSPFQLRYQSHTATYRRAGRSRQYKETLFRRERAKKSPARGGALSRPGTIGH
jgi:hypothetical protein